jgi:hypothetical protein
MGESSTPERTAGPPGVEPRRVVEARLRRFDRAALLAFVADLWTARGFETTREGRVVVADGPRGRTIVAAVPHRRLGPRSRPPPRADVIVAPGSLDDGGGAARVLDAGDVADLLWYGIDRERATAICVRHLDAPPAELRPPVPDRLRARLRSTALPDAATGLAAALVVLLVAGGVALAVGSPVVPAELRGSGASVGDDGIGDGDGEVGDADGGIGGDAESVEPTPAALDVSQTPPGDPVVSATPRGGPGMIPGVDADGVANLTTLAVAHASALEGGSYTLRLATARPFDDDPAAPRGLRETVVRVAGDRYLLSTTVDGVRQRAVYHDGTDWYVASGPVGDATYDRFEGPTGFVAPDPDDLDRSLVEQYLSTPETTVAGPVPVNGRDRYRVVGRGTPRASALADADNYTAVASVDARGLVFTLVATFDVPTSAGSYGVRFEWRYENVGTTSVTEPDWSRREFPRNRAASERREPPLRPASSSATTGSNQNRIQLLQPISRDTLRSPLPIDGGTRPVPSGTDGPTDRRRVERNPRRGPAAGGGASDCPGGSTSLRRPSGRSDRESVDRPGVARRHPGRDSLRVDLHERAGVGATPTSGRPRSDRFPAVYPIVRGTGSFVEMISGRDPRSRTRDPGRGPVQGGRRSTAGREHVDDGPIDSRIDRKTAYLDHVRR